MKFFRYFPTVQYENVILTNVLLRAKLKDVVQRNAVVFYDYDISDSDRPDIIAHKYYGSSDYAWVVLFANDIVDPIHDWPLTYKEMQLYMAEKYGSVETATQTVKEYRNGKGHVVDYTTFLTLSADDRVQVSAYDWEMERNEAKRTIKLIDNRYLRQIVNEMREIFE